MNSSKATLILAIRLPDGSVSTRPLSHTAAIPAEADARYAIIVEQTGESPRDLRVKRRGDDLLVESDEGSGLELVIEDFYAELDCGFLPDARLQQGGLTGTTLDATSPAIASEGGDDVIWEPAEQSGGVSPLVWGGVAVGAGSIVAFSGGDNDDAAEPPPEEPAVNNRVTGTIVAGPVIEGNGLSVAIFRADGVTLLGTAKVAANGTFTLDVGEYTGVVIARVIDGDVGADYLDEATGAGKDLNAQLSAMEVITEPNSTAVININALTTLATELGLRNAGSDQPTAATANAANTAIAELFGMTSLHAVAVEATNGGNFNVEDGVSPGERYGAILASFSGADQINGGDSQKTIDDVLAGLTTDEEGKATLAPDTQAIIVQGAETVEESTGQLPSGDVSVIVDTYAPVFESGAEAAAIAENSGAGQEVYTASASDAGRVTHQLKATGDHELLSIDSATGKVTLIGNPDHEAKSSYAFTVIATDAAGNASEQAVSLAINDLDEAAPTITSGAAATAINENSGAGQVVYTAAADDSADVSGGVTFSLKPDNADDAAAFAINSSTGAVTLTANPDHETKSSYAFTVVATDAAGNSSEQAVSLAITDLDEAAPTITSGAAATAIDENSGAGQVIYTATADDSADVSDGVTFSLKPDNADDAAAFSINATTGAVSLTANPDHETKHSYAFTVIATDAAGNASEQAVSLTIGDLDEAAPTITSGAAATAIDENSGAGQVVYTAAADDSADVSGGVTYSLKPDNADDAAAFSIDSTTGKVTLAGNPDHETKSSYAFTVIATDAAGNSSEQAVSLAINDLDEANPSITSGAAAAAIDENSGAGQVVYTAVADDSADVSGGVTFSVKPDNADDAAAFAINSSTGAVTLSGNPNHEAKSSYAFTVVATDAAGNSSEQAVSLSINDLDEANPSITSGAAAAAIDENSGAGQVVYTAAADDSADVSGGVTFSLKPDNADDAAAFAINSTTGAVTLTANPDHETKSSYVFTVVATDAAGNSSEQAVSLSINDLDEANPSITSGAAAAAIDENSGAGQIVYTAVADDSADVSGGVNFSLKADNADDAAAFAIDSATGNVTLIGNPDHETKHSYAFTVIATDAAGNSSEQAVSLSINDLDEAAPTITSGAAASAIDENSGAAQVVYTATADDSADVSGGVTFSLKPDNADDAAALSINATTGAVTLTANPDHETKHSYAFTVIAADAAGNSSEQAVSLPINDLDEAAPTITSGAAAAAINENSGAGQVVYTATADDSADVSGGVTFSLKVENADDAAAFTIDATTGTVSLTENPDHETKHSYAFTVIAADAAGNSSEQAVSLPINDLDEAAPTITSGAAASAIDENSGAGQIIYTATADDSADVSDGVTFSLKAENADDAAAFAIDSATGKVTLIGNPDHETKSSYAFTVVATDPAGNSSEQAVSLAINDIDDAAPVITSGAAATAIDENNGASQVIYTATADDSADVSGGVTFSLKAADDHAAFSIDASTGAVTLTGNPDHEAKPSYAFTVVATDAAGNASEQAVSLSIGDLDDTAPTITSGAAASAIDENSGASQVVYTATADDSADVSGGVTYSLKPDNADDASAFSINSSTGAVTLTGNPDHEAKPSYAFTVVATDAAGNASEQAVSLAINDLDEANPSITSGPVASAIDENSGAAQVVYTATADDSSDVSGGVTFSLKTDNADDAAAFSINASTGAVTLTSDPDHETKHSYAFTVIATDAAGNSSEQAVSLAVNDLDEANPSITSGAAASAINENSGAAQVVYTATADDSSDVSGGVTFSLKADNADDAAAFSINASTGAVTLTSDPDHETKHSYAFTVVATDAAGNSSEQAVSLAINDLDEAAPTVTSGATASAINENSGASQVIYTAVADDSADISGGVTFSLKPDNADDAAAFSINASTGAVTLTGNPDYETKPSYAFTIVATDAAGNASEQAVSLAINDIADEIAPTVASIAITAATGIQNNTLNAGDVVTVTVAMSENTIVDTANGTPRLALTVGGDTVYATYASGSGTANLVFTYQIQANQTDASGISIAANALDLHGGSMTDAAGNAAVVTHLAVGDNASYIVDTAAPTASIVTDYETVPITLDLNGMRYDEQRQIAALGPDGTFAVVWRSGDFMLESHLYVQRFDANGDTIGEPTRIERDSNMHIPDSAPQITALGADGAFAVAWQGYEDGGDSSIFVQRFDTGGNAIGTPTLVEPDGITTGYDGSAQIAAIGSDGSFAVTWSGYDGADYSIFVQRFDANGDKAGASVMLEPDGVTGGQDQLPKIAALGSSGAFVVTWEGIDAGGEKSVFVQPFDSDGNPVGSPVLVEPDGVTDQVEWRVQITALGSDGAFAVTWEGKEAGGTDNSVFVQRFDASGSKVGSAIVLEANGVSDYDSHPQITALGSGGAFVATWYVALPDSEYAIMAQSFDSDGVANGPAIALEASSTGTLPQVAPIGDNGAFAIVWHATDSDGDSDIFVQTFDTDGSKATETATQLEAPEIANAWDTDPKIAAISDDGSFAVMWSGPDAVGNQITYVQRFNADGTTSQSSLITSSQSIAMQSSETGVAYFVHDSVTVNELGDITGAADNLWNTVAVATANSSIALAATGLADGSYKVYSVDDAGNLSAASAETITIDSTAPSFTSGAAAVAITENSGSGQAVYTAAATDAHELTFSLKAVDDHAAFSIDANTGAVTLTGDPDFETKASYAFTVVATDAAGNASEQAVALAINDIVDETAPTVSSVAITGSTGDQSATLNAGDTVSVTVAMSENTTVDTTDGTPRLALTIGAATVYASYASGSGSANLVFTYTIQASQTDANGISIGANALDLNGGSMTDAAGNAAVVTHLAVGDNASYLVDTDAPTLSSSTPADNATGVTASSNIVLNFSENVVAGSGNITISDGDSDTRTIDITDGDQVSISGSQVTINPTTDLNASSSYHVQIDSGALTDDGGNAHAGISDAATLNFGTAAPAPVVDTSIVVFDLVGGKSSSHSGRVFNSSESYTIYIRVDSDSRALNDSGPGWGIWTGAGGVLGSDDKVVFVGDGSPIKGMIGSNVTRTAQPGSGGFMLWSGPSSSSWAVFASYTYVSRAVNGQQTHATIWDATGLGTPHLWQDADFPQLGIGQHYLTQMPNGILTSQGLT